MPFVIKTGPAPTPKPSGRGSKALKELIDTAAGMAVGGWFEWTDHPKTWRPRAKKLTNAVPGVEVYQELGGAVIVRKAGTSATAAGAQPSKATATPLRSGSPTFPSSIAPSRPDVDPKDIQLEVLRHLEQAGRRVSLVDLKRAIGAKPGPWSHVSDMRLEGWVETEPVGQMVYVTITALGREKLKEAA